MLATLSRLSARPTAAARIRSQIVGIRRSYTSESDRSEFARKTGPIANSAKFREFFEQNIPFNTVLGMKIISLERRHCAITVPFKPSLIGDPFRGALHGGVLSALADATGGLAVMGTLDDLEARVATIDMRIDYLRPGLQEELTCTADIRRIGNRVATTSMRISQREGQYVVCEGRAVYNVSYPRDKRASNHPASSGAGGRPGDQDVHSKNDNPGRSS
eukprot:Opistho-2@4536